MRTTIIRQLLDRVLVALLLLTLAGCAGGPKIRVNQDPAIDLAAFRTYDFEPQLGTDRPGYTSLLSQYLKTATSRELEARGYRRGDDPDLLVNFYVRTKEKVQTTTTPSGPSYGGYYGYRRGYYDVWGGYETRTTQYTEGTLNIDIVDARRRQLVWEGVAVGRVREETLKDPQPRVDAVVAQIFEQFPYSAGR